MKLLRIEFQPEYHHFVAAKVRFLMDVFDTRDTNFLTPEWFADTHIELKVNMNEEQTEKLISELEEIEEVDRFFFYEKTNLFGTQK